MRRHNQFHAQCLSWFRAFWRVHAERCKKHAISICSSLITPGCLPASGLGMLGMQAWDVSIHSHHLKQAWSGLGKVDPWGRTTPCNGVGKVDALWWPRKCGHSRLLASWIGLRTAGDDHWNQSECQSPSVCHKLLANCNQFANTHSDQLALKGLGESPYCHRCHLLL